MSNFAKLYQRMLSRPQTDEINDLTLLWLEFRDFFEDDRALIDEWLSASVPALSGARPRDLVSTFAGRQAVRAVLDAMRYGDFS
ncbi:MAG: MbcA/ParS/Xre antitoxin family protein [Parahaliea sp.]